MPKTRPPYAPEFRQQMVKLIRAGRDLQDLACELKSFAQAIRNWVADADRWDGRRKPKPATADATLTSTEWAELARLPRENKQLRLEREILSRAAAWFARETGHHQRGLHPARFAQREFLGEQEVDGLKRAHLAALDPAQGGVHDLQRHRHLQADEAALDAVHDARLGLGGAHGSLPRPARPRPIAS